MALDVSKDSDYVLNDESGVIIVADRELLKDMGTITVDWTGIGFNIKSENPLEVASGGCGGCSGGDTC